MNINSIHSYEGIKSKNYATKDEQKSHPLHPLMKNDELTFQSGIKPSLYERVLAKIKNTDYLELLGKLKQGIEAAGFFALFLIQDFLGMTIPRTWTGFNRDKEVTGKFHIQEGCEVFGREGLTGPAMMAIPAAAFAVGGLALGKSTFTNSRLIRSFGKTLTQLFENGTTLTRQEARSKYFESAIKKMFNETVLKDIDNKSLTNITDKLNALSQVKVLEADIEKAKVLGAPKQFTVKDIADIFGKEFDLGGIRGLLKDFNIKPNETLTESQVLKLFKSIRKELTSRAANEINGTINNALLESKNGDLSRLNKVIFDENSYGAKEITEALIKYSDDAITMNKNFDNMDTQKAEEFMNSMLGKRCVVNLATMASVLGIMNYLPKIYAYGETAPGQVSKEMAKCNTDVPKQKTNVAFTGLYSSIGKKVGKLSNTTLAEGEFNGINFSNTIMSAISIVGLTIPRAKRAYSRAPEKTPEQRQNEGWFSRLFKKDASEIKEIAVRDPISALSVVFAVPLLTRAMVKSYENKSGFVLINHLEDEGKGIKKFLKYLNPYNAISVLENAELNALYGNIDSHSKLLNVSEYIARKGGDLEKIFAKSEFKEQVFNDGTFTLASIKKEAKNIKNNKIIELIKNADVNMQKTMVDSLLPAIKKNKALGVAKTLNALPFFLNLLVVSPFLLGIIIPKYTYKLTQKANNQANDAQNITPAAQMPNLDVKETEKQKVQVA